MLCTPLTGHTGAVLRCEIDSFSVLPAALLPLLLLSLLQATPVYMAPELAEGNYDEKVRPLVWVLPHHL